jgi:hypothetical protein
MIAKNPVENESSPTETINGITVTDTTGQKSDGGRILTWKGPIPEERAQPETPKSEE